MYGGQAGSTQLPGWLLITSSFLPAPSAQCPPIAHSSCTCCPLCPDPSASASRAIAPAQPHLLLCKVRGWTGIGMEESKLRQNLKFRQDFPFFQPIPVQPLSLSPPYPLHHHFCHHHHHNCNNCNQSGSPRSNAEDHGRKATSSTQSVASYNSIFWASCHQFVTFASHHLLMLLTVMLMLITEG